MSDIRVEVLEAVDDGFISSKYLLEALVSYLSPDDMKQCLHANDIQLPSELEEDEEQ